MKKLLQVDFDFAGPFGEQMSAALKDLAESINHERYYLENLDRKPTRLTCWWYLPI